MGLIEDRKQNAADLKADQEKYATVANQRLQNISHGEFSPWLMMKQAAIDHFSLRPDERAQPGAPPAFGFSTPESQSRDQRWDEAAKQAEAMANGAPGVPQRFNP